MGEDEDGWERGRRWMRREEDIGRRGEGREGKEDRRREQKSIV